MTQPTTRLSYGDCFDAFERAKDDPKGIRIKVKDFSAAQTFRSRLHTARKVDRVDNTYICEESDPLYGRSVYDKLVVRLKEDVDGNWWVYIEPTSLDNLVIESLSQVEAE